MPNYFLTFRAHQTNTQVFEDFFLLFNKTIAENFNGRKKWSYSVEWDNTPNRHLHIVMFDFNDEAKLRQMFNGKQYKLLIHYMNTESHTPWNKDTDNEPFLKIIRCNDKDPLSSTNYYLGYTNKFNCTRRAQKDVSEQEITDAVELYHTNRRLESGMRNDKIVTLINNKNIYSFVTSFVNDPENNTNFKDHDLKYKTVKFGKFGYSQVSQKTQATAFMELRIMNNVEFENDKKNCNNDTIHPDQKEYELQVQEDDERYKGLREAKNELLHLLSSPTITLENIERLRKKYNTYYHKNE